MNVMKNIRDMIKYNDFAINMFQPMKETILLLKKHSVQFEYDYISEIDLSRIKCKDI